MAELEMADSEIHVKKVLVCFGERKREVSFSSEGGNEELLKQTRLIFRDIVDSNNFVLQLKSEEWDGLFLDVTDDVSVADKSVLRAVLPNQPTASTCGNTLTLREESRSVTSKALSGLKRISKTSGACAKVLATIFPSTKSVPPKELNIFDPLDDCVAQSAQNKKKSSKVKSVSVKVILVPKYYTLVLPKGRKRQKLMADKRIELIEIKRNMSPADVHMRIAHGFKHLNLQNWEYLFADAGKLSVSTNQTPGGEIVDRRGGLYIREKEEETFQGTTVIVSTSQGTASSIVSTFQGTASSIASTSQGTASSVASTSHGTASSIASTSQGTASSIASTSHGTASSIASTSQGTSPSIASTYYSQEISTPILKDGASSTMSSDDELLPPAFSSRVPGKINESIEQTRVIRAEQDREYEEGLLIDQTKERKRLWTENVQASKLSLREKLTSTNTGDGKQIYMRLPNGDRVGSTFSHKASCQVLYEYVFAVSDLQDPYGIYCTFPRAIVTTEQTIADVQGVLIVDEKNGYFDPVSLVHLNRGVCVENVCVQSKSDVLSKANETRMAFVNSQEFYHGSYHCVKRGNVFEDVISLYQNEANQLLKEYPLRVCFEGEKGVDEGGVLRDMYSAFYDSAFERLFDGSSLLCPVVHPEMDKACLSTFGLVLSHSYLVSGIFPVRIAFPCLVQSLLGTSVSLSDAILLESFIDSVSIHEAGILKEAMAVVGQQVPVFSSEIKSELISLFSRYNGRQVPTPNSLKQMVVNLARYEFVSKPAAALSSIHCGVPEQHHVFWDNLMVDGLRMLYWAQSVSSATVLKMFEEAEGSDQAQDRVLGYLRQFIGNMGLDELRTFLRFVTGSSVCSSSKITIEFNALTGSLRRPIASTCAPSLILSSTYPSYQVFVSEFRACLSSEYLWRMDSY